MSFLNALKSELSMLSSRKGSPKLPKKSKEGQPVQEQSLTKKASDGQLLGQKKPKKQPRRYSDDPDESVDSPKASSCIIWFNDLVSHPKTIENQLHNLEMMHTIWKEEFEEMISYLSFTE